MLTYQLPQELIAKYPSEPRDASRLLVLNRGRGAISHQIFRDLPQFLQAGDCLVLNDTQVIPARLYGTHAKTGGKVELLLLKNEIVRQNARRIRPAGFAEAVWRTSLPLVARNDENIDKAIYRCLGQPAKRLKPGAKLLFDHGSLQAEVLSWDQGERLVQFLGENVEEALSRWGEIPLPPYIDRMVEEKDAQWYQTVYAREPGAVAAPTAGLHFTEELLDQIRAMEVRIAFVTLHVGWGTFKPVGEKELKEAKLHPEQFEIPAETLEAIRTTKANGGRVIAVGTTVVRALETLATGGSRGTARMPRAVSQTLPVPSRKGSRTVRARQRTGPLLTGPVGIGVTSGTTDLFIRPPFEFKIVDAIITNFHLPGTSLLFLVSAFAGEDRIQAVYEEAIAQRYRFYSYGDAMLIL